RTVELLEQIAQRVEKQGIEAWQSLDPAELLGEDAAHYEKNRDTLDVWFDSGSTHFTVLGGKDNATKGSHSDTLRWPADLYLEGSDQHRGWFHSSLLTSSMLFGEPPYRNLLTHGFVVDGQGRKMSKSMGNVIAPQKVSDSLGAEIIRLWTASTDYSGELSISDQILKRVVEGYRRIRNTVCFLLGNLNDFDAAQDMVETSQLFEVDQYALALTQDMQNEVTAYYDEFNFHPAMARLQIFCSEDLGSFYLDTLKDRLYVTERDSLARRSAQTALLHITLSLLKLLAPVLSFTAEEAWQELQKSTLKNTDSADTVTIFTEVFHTLPEVADHAALSKKWQRILQIRADLNKQLEDVRSAGRIGSALQAEVDVFADGLDLEYLQSLNDDLRFVFIVSRATVHAGAPGEGVNFTITPSEHRKCERCWHYREEVGTIADHPDICSRCDDNLHHGGEDRHYA